MFLYNVKQHGGQAEFNSLMAIIGAKYVKFCTAIGHKHTYKHFHMLTITIVATIQKFEVLYIYKYMGIYN
jgi:hypothetical protein